MLDKVSSMVLKSLHNITQGYIIYNCKKYNIWFMSEMKIFFQYSKINKTIDI